MDEILEFLGEGRTGEVKFATDTVLSTAVALQTPSPWGRWLPVHSNGRLLWKNVSRGNGLGEWIIDLSFVAETVPAFANSISRDPAPV